MFGQAVLRVHRSAPVFEVCPACSLTWTSAPLATLTTARPLCQPQFLWSAASSSLSHTSWQHEKNYVHVTLEGVVLAVMKKLSKSAIIFSRKTWHQQNQWTWHVLTSGSALLVTPRRSPTRLTHQLASWCWWALAHAFTLKLHDPDRCTHYMYHYVSLSFHITNHNYTILCILLLAWCRIWARRLTTLQRSALAVSLLTPLTLSMRLQTGCFVCFGVFFCVLFLSTELFAIVNIPVCTAVLPVFYPFDGFF